MSNSLQSHELQHIKLPCPALSLRVCSNSCPLSQWCYTTISSSVSPFSSCPQSFPASRSFPTSWLFTSGNQSIGASALAPVLPMNIQGWFPLGLIDWFDLLAVQGTLFSNTMIWKHQFFSIPPFSWSSSHIRTWTTGETTVLTIVTYVGKVISLLCNMLSRFVMAFLPRSKRVLISWLPSPFAVILEPKERKSAE